MPAADLAAAPAAARPAPAFAQFPTAWRFALRNQTRNRLAGLLLVVFVPAWYLLMAALAGHQIAALPAVFHRPGPGCRRPPPDPDQRRAELADPHHRLRRLRRHPQDPGLRQAAGVRRLPAAHPDRRQDPRHRHRCRRCGWLRRAGPAGVLAPGAGGLAGHPGRLRRHRSHLRSTRPAAGRPGQGRPGRLLPDHHGLADGHLPAEPAWQPASPTSRSWNGSRPSAPCSSRPAERSAGLSSGATSPSAWPGPPPSPSPGWSSSASGPAAAGTPAEAAPHRGREVDFGLWLWGHWPPDSVPAGRHTAHGSS